ncbi:hypothetical protein AAG570_014041 [Ranatra chinensis]|uniref:Flagellar biosynthesis protein FlhA n=1 Tax=Ranatra chinensis TaxID=642074 RepID=A0ABD0XS98_9HEMI
MVITKGSGRVAEVAARFTLDAMPGKQMSIDADLNAGVIDEAEAKLRREEVRREADFYGSMDGASKFIRGDAIAGLIITAINIVGGLIIGVVQHGMTVGDAARRFTLLTVGDGLVGQIPALIISTAAGIVVTRAGSNEVLSEQLIRQLFPQAKILLISAALLIFFALLPGMPKIPFIFIALIMGGSGILMSRSKSLSDKADTEAQAEDHEEEAPAGPRTEEEEVRDLLTMDTLELEIGFALIPLVSTEQGGTLLGRIKSIRRQLATDMGFIVPPVRIKDNLQLDTNSYSVLLKGVKCATGKVFPDKLMVMNPSGDLSMVDGISTVEPAFQLQAKWIDDSERDNAELAGYTIVDPATIISTHLTEIIKTHSYELVGRQEVQELLEKVAERSPQLVAELIPGVLDLGTVTRVLQNLLKEKVSIRNLPTIIETLSTFGVINKDVSYLTEKVRLSLSRQISESLLASDGVLHFFSLPSEVEQILLKSLQQSEDGVEIVTDPALFRKIVNGLNERCSELSKEGIPPVLIVAPIMRMPMRRLLDTYIKNLNIITPTEIADNVRIDSMGAISVNLNEPAGAGK